MFSDVQKSLFLSANFALLAGFFGISATIRIGRDALSPVCGIFFHMAKNCFFRTQ